MKSKKIISFFLCLIFLTSFICVKAENAEYQILDSEYVRLLGRGEVKDGGKRTFNWPNAGIEFKFSGSTAEVYVDKSSYDSTASEGNFFNVAVYDGETLVRVERIKLVLGWNTIYEEEVGDPEVKKIMLVRSSEACRGTLTMSKIRCDASPSATVPRKRRIEFIGDSYTAGYGNSPDLSESTSYCAQNTDNWNAYTGVVARELRADNTVIAYQGKGVYANQGTVTYENTMPQQFLNEEITVDGNTSSINLSEGEKHNFSSYQPQVVSIWLGTNDAAKNVDIETFKTEYTAFLDTVRSKYPDAHILNLALENSLYLDTIKDIVNDSSRDEENKYYMLVIKKFTTTNLGHPDIAEGERIAQQVIDKINSIPFVWSEEQADENDLSFISATADGNKKTVKVTSEATLTEDNVIIKSVETGELLPVESVESDGESYKISFMDENENIGGEYVVLVNGTDNALLFSVPVGKGASVLLEENFDYTTMGNFYNPQDPRYQPTWDTSIWTFSHKNWWNSFAYKTGSGAKIIDGALHVQAQWGSRDVRFFNGLKHSFANIDDGKFEISFDMAAFNEKVDASRTDAADQVAGFMLFVNGNQEYDLIFVNEENIYYYDNNERKLLEGYASSNQTGNFDAYKAVLDFDEEKILYYFEDEKVAEGVMPATMINGVSSITFAQHRDAENPKLSDQPQIGICHSLIDNVVLAVDGVYDNAGVESVRYNTPISTQHALQAIPANITDAVITFANPMDVIEKGKIAIKNKDGEEISTVGELSGDGLSYTLVITEPLTEGEEYTLFIDKTVKNKNGLTMQRDYNGKITAAAAVEIFNVNRFVVDRDKVAVDIFNSLKKEGKIYLSYAIYDDGVMRDVKIKEIDLIEDASSNDFIQTELYFVAKENETVKAFLWEDNNGMKSLENCVVSYGTGDIPEEETHNEIISQTGDEQITICGRTDASKNVSVDVYAPGMTYTDLPQDGETGIKNILVYRNETISDENGSYCFVFGANDEMKNILKSGLYNVRISVDGEVTEEKVVFSEKTENEEAILKLLTAVENKDYDSEAEDSFVNVFNTCTYELGLNDTYFNTLDKNAIMKSMYESLADDKVTEADRKQITDYFEASVLMEKLNKGMCENIFDYLDLFGIEESRLKDFYKEKYVTESFEKAVTKGISKVNITGKKDFYEKFTECFVCHAASTTEGVGHIEDILKEFDEEIGINTSGTSQKVYSKLVNENYANYEELKEEFNRIKKTYTTSGGSGGSSGGSSGGNKNNKGNGTTYSGVISNPVIEDMNYNIFDDIENVAWAKESIVKLAEKGILRGKQEGLFFPDDNITREEFVKIIVMGLEISEEDAKCEFADVDITAWYYSYVAIAFENEVVKGISDTEFGIGNKITRQDLAVMAYRAAVGQGKKFKEVGDGFKFTDDSNISDYAKEAVYALYASGIINGIDGVNFAPDAFATRAQAAKILYQITEL